MSLSNGILATGEAAKLSGVAPKTIQKWCDRGGLHHERLPTTGVNRPHRRIDRNDLYAWLLANGTKDMARRVLPPVRLPVVAAIGLGWPLGELLGAGVRYLETDSPFELGRLCTEAVSADLACAVVGWSIGAEAARGVIRELLFLKDPPPPIVALVPEDCGGRTQEVYALGVRSVLVCPQPAAAVADTVRRLMEAP